jgi:hypothetical protein
MVCCCRCFGSPGSGAAGACGRRCTPNQEAADRQAANNAVEEIAGPAAVPNELTLDFRNGEQALVTEVPKAANGEALDGDATHWEGEVSAHYLK